jgi:TldD protein
VRALVDGYWGFASGPVWSLPEMARLGREAVHQAKTNALGKPRPVELAPAPTVPDGHWVMPVKIDPFELPPVEIQDFLKSLEIFTKRTPGTAIGSNQCNLLKQEKVFGSSAGSYFTQRRYLTSGAFALILRKDGGKVGGGSVDLLSPAGVGWELYRDQPLREAIRQVLEEIEEDLKLPVNPVEVGRYDTVFDAASVARLVDVTLGAATELDRALGYEANAGGTSYLNDPLAMLGSYQAGSPLLTITANRSEPGGCATVRWDDDGVVPDEFTLVKDGVLADFQTTRESAGWLKEWYTKAGIPFRSHGCASASDGSYAPLQRRPNLALVAGREAYDFDALVAGVASGIAIKGATLDMDFQHLNGLGVGRTYEIKKGKRVARIANAGLLFRSPELWKGLLALGGPGSERRYGRGASKGEPAQGSIASVTAPPAVFKQLTVIDPLRKA